MPSSAKKKLGLVAVWTLAIVEAATQRQAAAQEGFTQVHNVVLSNDATLIKSKVLPVIQSRGNQDEQGRNDSGHAAVRLA